MYALHVTIFINVLADFMLLSPLCSQGSLYGCFFLSSNVLLAYTAYAIGTASLGPSNLAIMSMAMHSGRKYALIFALGVAFGSAFWGFLAALGLSSILIQYAEVLVAMKILGGLYLLWLAYKSARATLVGTPVVFGQVQATLSSVPKIFFQGALMHLSNPKAIFVWLSIVALALPAHTSTSDALWIVAGSLPIGIFVFCCYALLFSTHAAKALYLRTKRYFDGTLAVLFGYAGWRMLRQ